MTTYCESIGLKVGDNIRVLRNGVYYRADDILTLSFDDRTKAPRFVTTSGREIYFGLTGASTAAEDFPEGIGWERVTEPKQEILEPTQKSPEEIAPKLWNAYKDKLNDEALEALRGVICGEHPEELNFIDAVGLSRAFKWGNTPQGHDFWAGVCYGERTKRPEEHDPVNTPSALDVQEGGIHYKTLPIQPVVYIQENKIPYMEGNVIKYVTRWRDKGGIEDLKKAKHYLEMLIEYEQNKE